MKTNMKLSWIIPGTILFIASGMMNAQEYKIPVENAKESTLSLSGFSGDVTIEGYAGNEIVFISENLETKTPDRAKGLKPVYPGGVDNTGMGLSVEKNGNQIEVACLLPFTTGEDYTIRVPENLALKMQEGCENSGDIFVKKMKNEIEIQTCQSIILTDVSGPLVLSTISGDVEVAFGTLNTSKPVSINSVSGEIDITLPAKIAADIEMGSVTGTMYSDFDFNDTNKDMKKVGGNQLESKLNGGGTKFSLVTVSGNIYLRKGM